MVFFFSIQCENLPDHPASTRRFTLFSLKNRAESPSFLINPVIRRTYAKPRTQLFTTVNGCGHENRPFQRQGSDIDCHPLFGRDAIAGP